MAKHRALDTRIGALERRFRPPQEPIRLILVWRDDAGRLTKVADSDADEPDGATYYEDFTRGCADGPAREDDGTESRG